MPQAPLLAPPEAVIFDIGGVILRLNLARAFEPLATALDEHSRQGSAGAAATRFAPEKIWAAIRSDPRWREWQQGRVSPEDWHRHITRQLGVSIGFEDFCAAWNRALDPHPMFADEFYAALAARCRLALLSNTDPLHVKCLEQQFSFIRYFPVRIYSCRVGACKPAAEIYRAALEELGVAASSALYVDDVPAFVDAARGIGMDAIRFETTHQFSAEITRRGLPPPANSVQA